MAEKTSNEAQQDSISQPIAAASSPRVVLCEVFRSPRREGMYLYVERSEGLARVPETLVARFGTPEPAFVFRLHGERRLARASAPQVLKALAEQGFYLQMPPLPGAGTEDGDGSPTDGQAGADGVGSPAALQADREEPLC